MCSVITTLAVLAVTHIMLGLISFGVGAISSSRAVMWLAHTVSPVWSGACFIICGVLGLACAKRKTAYMIMCFTAFSFVSLITAIVSIQLLRIGLVNHTSDGQTYAKEKQDILIILALTTAGLECVNSIVSSFMSCLVARMLKKKTLKGRRERYVTREQLLQQRQAQIREQQADEERKREEERRRMGIKL
ncbi:transmembrane protein 196-like [Saccoglossus kowalevskii]|uniref:Transmembrane protein 196 n=1 Tax=Saccoglossus kowalevskii TaxID=10224 RepID=A0ABM0M702_SACKO|nr:PREDICTED: transmembrane protein 196-like [Saccoglossus kowalevskii]